MSSPREQSLPRWVSVWRQRNGRGRKEISSTSPQGEKEGRPCWEKDVELCTPPQRETWTHDSRFLLSQQDISHSLFHMKELVKSAKEHRIPHAFKSKECGAKGEKIISLTHCTFVVGVNFSPCFHGGRNIACLVFLSLILIPFRRRKWLFSVNSPTLHVLIWEYYQ